MSNEAGSGEPPEETPERRAGQRIPRRESVSIQLWLSRAGQPGHPRVVAGETMDLSVRGLRLRIAEPVESDRILDLCVDVKDHPKRFLLTAETRWCRHDMGNGGYQVGLLIYDGEGTDYREWCALLKGQCE
jgi:PilZ domain